jgi:thioredoxin 1
MAHEINDNEFENEVINSKQLVLVDFWAPWCGPCKMVGPVLEQISEEMKDVVKVLKMNIDNNPDAPSALGVRSIPTLMLFKDGKQIAVKVGAQPKNVLKEWINSFI